MLSDTIRADMIASMKAGEALRLSVLRMILSEMNYKKIEVQRDLTDVDVLAVLQKEAKKRREAIESYIAGGREEQAKTEREELVILEKYLPEMLSEGEIKIEVTKLLSDQDIREFGQAMKIVSPALKGKAEGGMVAKIVKDLLAK
jgi:uncharacterized protein